MDLILSLSSLLPMFVHSYAILAMLLVLILYRHARWRLSKVPTPETHECC